MESFVHLQAWKEGLVLVKDIYKITQSFPSTERYGLTSQIRRASTSILANLAEGFSRASSADKAYKYIIARGECAEVHALLEICRELGFVETENARELIQKSKEIGRMVNGLVRKFSCAQP